MNKIVVAVALFWVGTLFGQISMNPKLGDFPNPSGQHPQVERLLPTLAGNEPLTNITFPILDGYDFSSWGASLDNKGATLIGNYALDIPLGMYRDQISEIVSADGYALGIPEPSEFILTVGIFFLVFVLWLKNLKETS